MSEATAAASPGATAGGTGTGQPEHVVYAVGGFRRLVICLLVLLLLPFAASLPIMLHQRIKAGQTDDIAGLLVLSTGFAIILFLLLVNLMFSLRARVDLGPSMVRLTLPAGRGPTPMLTYRTHEFPYGEVAAVETRREIYGGSIAPVMLRGARIVKRDGTIVKLGYDSEANQAPAFPYLEIAEKIAARAGVPVTDQGSVHRSAVAKMMAIPGRGTAPEPQIDQAEIDRLNRQHLLVILALVAVVVTLVGVGIWRDMTVPPSSHSATPLPIRSAPR